MSPCGDVPSLCIKFLNTVIFRIRHIDKPICIRCNADRTCKHPLIVTHGSPFGNKFSILIKFLNSMIVRICHIDHAVSVHCNIYGALKLSVSGIC